MGAGKTPVDTVDPNWKWLYRVGGVSALVLGVAYIIIVALYVPMGAPPSGPEALLVYMAENTGTWWAILGLSVLTDFLFVPLALALYLALKGTNRNVVLVATAFIGLFVVLDLAVTQTSYASLIAISSDFAAATKDAERAVLVAAAIYPATVIESTLLDVYNTVTLAIGILMSGLVMLKGVFGKSAAFLGLGTGFLGVVAVAGPFLMSSLSVVIIITSVLTTAWVLLVGYKLFRLGQ